MDPETKVLCSSGLVHWWVQQRLPATADTNPHHDGLAPEWPDCPESAFRRAFRGG